jgi:starch phosphorylase
MIAWQDALAHKWAKLAFGPTELTTNNGCHDLEVRVYLPDLDPDSLQVELYANGLNGDGPIRLPMERIGQLPGNAGEFVYRAQIPTNRPDSDFTARVVPRCPGVAVPLETAHLLWQR